MKHYETLVIVSVSPYDAKTAGELSLRLTNYSIGGWTVSASTKTDADHLCIFMTREVTIEE